MNTYKIAGVDDAKFSKDGSSADLVLRTNKGDITLSVKSKHLDQLITKLEGLAYEASLLNSTDDQGRVRLEMVDGYKIGRGMVDGVAYVAMAFGLGQGRVVRWYALSGTTAGQLQQALTDEIPKLAGEGGAST